MQESIHGNSHKRRLKKINRSSHQKKESNSYSIKYNKTFGTKMSEKGSVRGSYQVWGGQWGWWGWGRVRDAKGYGYSGDTTKHKGLCSALGIHIFD